MFGTHFYNKNIRNIVILFGTVFNDISVERTKSDNTRDQKFKVPISYGPKEKYLARVDARKLGDVDYSIGMTLPRMSFEITSMTYDAIRKLQKTKRHKEQLENQTGATHVVTSYTPVPYNFDVELNVMVKNSDDGAQILEQIMPFFSPDFHVTIKESLVLGINRDIPIIMNSITTSDTYEGDMITRRALIHTLTFTVMGYVYGPTANIGLIREVDVNIGAQIPDPKKTDLNIHIEPKPEDANPEDDFGFTTTVTDL
tara:strand:+ start:12027 stop:12794 length:768 start_codon:yes stop_codon:yes gene_type:complete